MLASVVRAALRRPNEPLNIVLLRTSEEFDARICRACPTDRFWAFALPGEAPWNTTDVTPPDNLVLFNRNRGDDQFSGDMDFDLVISPFRDIPLGTARNLSAQFHLPLLTFFHDPPAPGLATKRLAIAVAKAGHIKVVRSLSDATMWGLGRDDVVVAPNWDPDKLRNLINGAASGPYELKWSLHNG